MIRISALLRIGALSLLPLLSGCQLFFQECAVVGCSSPLIVKNESSQILKSCESENSSACREIGLGSSFVIGEFRQVEPNGTWLPLNKRSWLVFCNRAVRVNELGSPGRRIEPQYINGSYVVVVTQEVAQRVCGS